MASYKKLVEAWEQGRKSAIEYHKNCMKLFSVLFNEINRTIGVKVKAYPGDGSDPEDYDYTIHGAMSLSKDGWYKVYAAILLELDQYLKQIITYLR